MASSRAAVARDDEAYDNLLSRVTLEVPFITQHLPAASGFDDHNWGLVVDFALDRRWSVVGGEFDNSYHRETDLLGARYSFLRFAPGPVSLDFGAVAGADLNGGYRGHNPLDPLMAAVTIKITGNGFSQSDFLNHSGFLISVIPGQVTAINLALSVGL